MFRNSFLSLSVKHRTQLIMTLTGPGVSSLNLAKSVFFLFCAYVPLEYSRIENGAYCREYLELRDASRDRQNEKVNSLVLSLG